MSAVTGQTRRWIFGERPLRIILGYHRIGSIDEWSTTETATSPRHLVQQLNAISNLGPIVPLSHLLSRPKEDGVAITFDDGYQDNATVAAGILNQGPKTIPATFFVASRYVTEGHAFIWDSIDFLNRDQSSGSTTQLLLSHLNTLSVRDRWDIVTSLSERARVEGLPTGIGPMSVADLTQLALVNGFSAGNHSATHFSLGTIPLEEARRDVSECEQFLCRIAATPSNVLAFPFGRQRDVRSIRDFAGIVPDGLVGLTTTPEAVSGRCSFRVPRLMVGDQTADQLLGLISQGIQRSRRRMAYHSAARAKHLWADSRPMRGSREAAMRMAAERLECLLK